MVDKLLYNIAEAGEIIGLKRSKMYMLINSGALKSVTVGTRRLITVKALEEFVESLQVEKPFRLYGKAIR